MFKSLRHIVFSVSLTLIGLSAGAKDVQGISPVYTPHGGSAQSSAWNAAEPGRALMELEMRSPDRKTHTLVQEDGIVDFRPGKLAGPRMRASGSSEASFVSRLPQSKIPGGSNLCGFISYNEINLNPGVYRLPIAEAQHPDVLCDMSEMLSSFRGGAADSRYYVMSYYGTTIQNGENLCMTAIFDMKDWSMVGEAGNYGEYERVASDMTFDPSTNRFYGCFLNRGQSQWLLGYMQMNPQNPASTVWSVTGLSQLEVSLNGIAADANGVLWGIRNDNGDLVTINKKTGEMTKVASTGFVPGYNGSLTWDNTNGILYWAVTYADAEAPGGMSSALLTVDPITGALAQVYKFTGPAQTCGLYTEFTAAGHTPGIFSNLAATFENNSLSGTLTFDAPDAYSDGTAVSGSLKYTLTVVKDNGYVALNKEMSCRYGEKGISVPVELATPGYYTFTVQGKNETGVGYPLTLTNYVGSDLPNMAQNLKVDYADNAVNVTWDAVTTTVHGGYFNPDKVTYKVELTHVDADGNIVALPTQTTTVPNAVWEVAATEELQAFKASVTTMFDVNEGETASTSYVWFGALTSPFVQKMTASVDGWTSYAAEGSSAWAKVNGGSNGSGWAIPYYWGSQNNAWLFSPALKFEKGRYYTISFRTWSTVVTQSLHVWMGNDVTVEAMNKKLADVSVPGSTKPSKASLVTFGFECEESGIYHLGIHNDTRSDTWTNMPYMWVNDVTCDVAPDSAPSAPGLNVDYDKSGAIAAKVSVTAPSTTFAGAELTTVESVSLKCNGEELQKWENVAAGEVLEYEYEGEKAGSYSFIAEATMDGVSGVPVISNVYLGMALPVDPEWVNVTEREDLPGTVDVTWSPVSQSVKNQEIAEDAVSYNVMNIISNTYLERNVTEQPFEYKACDPQQQTSLYISVNAETSAGQSSIYGTPSRQSIMHVGTPYSLPFRENFADGTVHYSWTIVNQHSSYDRCSVINAREQLGDKDANGDGYCLLGFVPYEESEAGLYSGRISVPADAVNPVLGFAVYRVNYGDGADNDNTIACGIIGTKHQGALAPIRAGAQDFGWKYYYYDLSQFKGEDVNILFTFQTHSYTSHYIDDIHFFDAPKCDVGVNTVTVPAEAEPDSRVSVSVSLTNLGTSSVSRGMATLQLRRGDSDEVVSERDVPDMVPFQSVNVTMHDRLNNSFDSEVKYKAVLLFDGDVNADNDEAEATLHLNLSQLPAPQALSAERNDEGFASLAWEAPDLSPIYNNYEIGFEKSVEPSMTDLEGFTSIDVDGNNVDSESLGIAGALGFTSFYHPNMSHSGKWMLVSPCNADGAAKEDWLISPRLSGHEQVISFYARTNWNAYETFTVLTSTTGSEQADFTTKAMELTTSSNSWRRVELTVPEGTRYFSIVCKADDTTDLVYLMLDDFTFEGADSNEGLSVEGYNAYRDNVLIEEVADVKTWEDAEGKSGPHFYRVTARYGERGESGPSNEVFLFTRGTSVDGIVAATGKVYSRQGEIVIEGAQGCSVSVAGLDGIRIASVAEAAETEIVNVATGVYVVTIDGSSLKIVVP